MRERLTIEVRQTEFASSPFENRVTEDDCGETKIVVLRIKLSPSALCMVDGYQDALLDLLSSIISQLQVVSPVDGLEELFAKHRAQDRAFLVAQTPISISNLLSSPKYHLEDWSEHLGELCALKRTEPWRFNEVEEPVEDRPR